ncbi:MAG: NADH-ubiquinone oxidoreductase-F iron-sulfur binding region domain-containing protein [Woeseiaceae bacterium]|nr:NADH-ubiquinone oxidoreductase-F iron-sulfur binding region domain-containing protein [Woeseiaceae bacterium]
MQSAARPLAQEQLARYDRDPASILQMLRNLQLQQNGIRPSDIETLSEGLNVPATKIKSLIDFYSFLHDRPRGSYDIYLSDSITDRMLGGREVAWTLCRELGVRLGEPRPDGMVTVSTTSCTGLCERGPAAIVDGLAIERVDVERAREMARLIKAGAPVDEWPLDWFLIDDEIHRKGPLLDADREPGAATERAIKLGPYMTLAELQVAGLRGCGGAGFETHQKWNLCRSAIADRRFVICNADEGEPGTFKDRALLNAYTDMLLEGMAVCAVTIGATRGFIYLRHEYEFLRDRIERRIQRRRDKGLLGRNILGHHGIDFDIEVYMGAGSYVCGEESALIESLEGHRGIPRIRPPFPVTNGYLGKPTVVNNVETLCYAAGILEQGPGFVANDGDEPGWKLLSISGDCAKPGIYEIPLGMPVRDVLAMCEAENVQAVQVGGPGGTLISADEFDRRVSFNDLNTAGAFIIFDESRDMLEVALNFTHFFAHESCGFCTPCRVGTKLMAQMADKLAEGHGARLDIEQMRRLHKIMTQASHCGLGQVAAVPILTAYEKFPDDFQRRMDDVDFQPTFDVEAAIERSKQIVREEEAAR